MFDLEVREPLQTVVQSIVSHLAKLTLMELPSDLTEPKSL